jgi:hypothetical protein
MSNAPEKEVTPAVADGSETKADGQEEKASAPEDVQLSVEEGSSSRFIIVCSAPTNRDCPSSAHA